MKRTFVTYFLVLASIVAWGKGAKPNASQLQVSVPQWHLDDWRTINYDSVQLRPSYAFMPLIYDHTHITLPQQEAKSDSLPPLLSSHAEWLDSIQAAQHSVERMRRAAIIKYPQLVHYNVDMLPDPPKEVVVNADPSRSRLSIDAFKQAPATPGRPIDRRRQLRRNWLHTLTSSLHFTQAYISENWYQGGENNVNVLGDVEWQFNLNQNLHPNLLFSNDIRYKLGVMTAHSDSLRNYAINEDNFQINTKFGYKAVRNWYYSATLQFKTQLLKSYTANSNSLTASFLSPGELNLGLGMTYNYTDPNKDRAVSLSIAPASYNLKICRDIDGLDPTTFGIDPGHHVKHNIGSNVECKFSWSFNANVAWTARLYTFTNYKYVQGDFENTFDFSITRHLETRLYVHLRYDRSAPRNDDWRFWQLKEILSLGLTYRFATN